MQSGRDRLQSRKAPDLRSVRCSDSPSEGAGKIPSLPHAPTHRETVCRRIQGLVALRDAIDFGI
jgi:hypothetical protein